MGLMTGGDGRVPMLPKAGDKPYDEYISAVGEVAFHWNALLEALALIFVCVAGTPRSVGLGIWYSLQSDRAQLDVLSAALRGREGQNPPWSRHPQALDDISWVVQKIQGSLSDRRNNAIHAPAELSVPVFRNPDGDLTFGDVELGPSFYHGHPRATKLKGKALILEFGWYASTALTLAQFTKQMDSALLDAEEPWPEKPRLPSLGQKPDVP